MSGRALAFRGTGLAIGRRRTRVSRPLGEGGATSALALFAASSTLFWLTALMGRHQLSLGGAAPGVGWVLCAGVGGLGVASAVAMISELRTFRTGRARLILASDPAYPGVPLVVVLEVPFALGDAPELDVSLSLAGSGPEAWARAVRVRPGDWEPAGRRSSRIALSAEAREPAAGRGAPRRPRRVSARGAGALHRCTLVATSRGPEPWSTRLSLPVRIVRSMAA